MPDGILEAVRHAQKAAAIAEGKGDGLEAQLLGAIIKCWSLNGVYPIGILLGLNGHLTLYHHVHDQEDHNFIKETFLLVTLPSFVEFLSRMWGCKRRL